MEIRPIVRLAQYDDDGTLEPVGDFSFEHFGTIPQVGDVLGEYLLGEIESLEVVRRWFITDSISNVWYLLVRAVDAEDMADLYDLHREVERVHAEIRAEHAAEVSAKLRKHARRKSK